MRETVRARALIELGDEACDLDTEATAGADLWSYLRPDQLLEAVRRRARFVEETNFA